MKLSEAFQVITSGLGRHVDESSVYLVTGFTPLHLSTFLQARLIMSRPNKRTNIHTGLFGDFCGNLKRAIHASDHDQVAVVLEWADLDCRLGLREGAVFDKDCGKDIVASSRLILKEVKSLLQDANGKKAIIFVGPTLPFPPFVSEPSRQVSRLELSLRHAIATFYEEIAALPSVQIASDTALAVVSRLDARLDLTSELATGFPYTLTHAAALAELLDSLMVPPTALKGIITDLDNTLWMGILGEVGIHGVAWDLASHARIHGLYQQVLRTLASSGTLIAIASKNYISAVDELFEQRGDLLINKRQIYPIKASWGPKSESVAVILKTWNIGAADVMFIDDSEIELAEVRSAFPEMQCAKFPTNDYRNAGAFLSALRDRFGKSTITEEDSLRLDSIRSAESLTWENGDTSYDEFLSQANQEVTIDGCDAFSDRRPLELVNKTNQFNMNGRRYTEHEWRDLLGQPEQFSFVFSYRDKFSNLGRVAVVTGRATASRIILDDWVMSCRAFGRRLEYLTVSFLLGRYPASCLHLNFAATQKNLPFQDFLRSLNAEISADNAIITTKDFRTLCPSLYHVAIDNYAKRASRASDQVF